MKQGRYAMIISAALLALAIAAGVAVATGVPTVAPLTYAGVITDASNKPYPTAVSVSVAFYNGEQATVSACESKAVMAQANTGVFETTLPAACAQAVHDSADLWSELTIVDVGQKLPRSRVGAIPYALEAAVASSAGGGLKAQLDGLVQDVAALKSEKATAWVVDADGQKLGTVLPLQTNLGISWVDFSTKTGHIIPMHQTAGTTLEITGCYFDQPACGGTAYVMVGGWGVSQFKLGRQNALWYPALKKFFVPTSAGTPSSPWFAVTTNTSIQSVMDKSGVCTTKSYTGDYIKGSFVDPTAIGLPAAYKTPFSINVF